MSASNDFQDWAETRLAATGVLPAGVPIVKRKSKGSIAQRTSDLAQDIEAAANNHGLCVFTMPAQPMAAFSELDSVFFPRVELRVRIVEVPSLNEFGADLYDLVEAVSVALHFQQPPGHAEPIRLNETPTELLPETERERAIDVIFRAAYGLQPTP